ncbi:GNAT family N-acetyltransferase [Nafulsella turpanensis]|uniref:GNAT family N-acetyltransferase n=1 Tax=Nafulsella turpanensis TaxID=1265690 RepID=UPI00034AE9F1|nr:GNAT family N-acetyltransferase [Nafulsella turpanensis]
MLKFREITKEDNPRIAAIIRAVMQSFNADPATTILGDPVVDRMFESYQVERAVYYVALLDGEVVGGCGIKALDGGPEGVAELQRMFLKPEARGLGIAGQLMERCLHKAADFGYRQVYLETLGDMLPARALYRKYGFSEISQPMGNTGHGGCDIRMLKEL